MVLQEFERELDLNRKRIDDLREYEHEVEMHLRVVRGRVGWLRALWFYLLRRELTRQVRLIKWRNNAVRNCYLQAIRDEERARASARR
jgi:hypothetical protein